MCAYVGNILWNCSVAPTAEYALLGIGVVAAMMLLLRPQG